jgi:hypothetical protein
MTNQMLFLYLRRSIGGLRLALTILWIQLLALPYTLNPGTLMVPGAPASSNLAIVVKFLCLGMLLLLGVTSSGTVLVGVLMGTECAVELVGGLSCCAGGIALAALLLKKLRGRIGPLWIPAPAGAITGGLAVAAAYPFSEPEHYCWLGGVYCIVFAILCYAGGAGLAALTRFC